MSDLILPRRKLLLGLGAMFAAPAIVRAASLMPVKVWREDYWIGTIGTFAIWNRELTVDEMQAIMAGESPLLAARSGIVHCRPA